MSQALPAVSIAEHLAERIAALRVGAPDGSVTSKFEQGEDHSVPSPLVGEGQGGGAQTSSAVVPPTPSPSPQGGGEPPRDWGEGGGSAEAVGPLSAAARQTCESLVLDVIGLAVAARSEPYMRAALAAWDEDGPCTAIGHARTLTAAGAAFVNGTAAHGEDFDDTFEGGPVHAGAVILPAVLAACERYGRHGEAVLVGIAVGAETLCRLSLVAPRLIHKAGFHPTAVLGAMGAAAGVSAALALDRRQIVDALGIAGSMASGIIEYLAEGAWTKRLHPGWAAQAGLRAALLARHGFLGPRTVFEGTHGLFHGFAHTTEGDYDALTADFGERWLIETLAFKPYPCGTMTHPYIDCARRLAARGVTPGEIAEMVCEVGEGTVHRLWEPLADKQRPPNGYAGKFSQPYCIARALVRGNVGLDAFTDAAVCDPAVLGAAGKVRYVVDPDNPYPRAFTGHIRATLNDGRVLEERQPHIRGGAREPLTRPEIEEKFALCCRHGGWGDARTGAALALARRLFDGEIDLGALRA
jgi:2-methylcitrate dehydratase PrpD